MQFSKARPTYKALRKEIDGIIYKQCYRCKEFFPEETYKGSYCSNCSKEAKRERDRKLRESMKIK